MHPEEYQSPSQIRSKKSPNTAEERLYPAIKEQKIRSALGCPITRRILDAEECIILDIGDLVTSKAVIQAGNAGVLDLLLSSVYQSPARRICSTHLRPYKHK